MASGGKKKTTMAKLNRERKLRERRQDKQARKDARKAGVLPDRVSSELDSEGFESAETGAERPDLDAAVPAAADA